jgi:phosphomethylpyrimidine synthase
MKITEDVGKFAAEQKLSEQEAVRVGMEQKAKEFVEKGAEVYAKLLLDRYVATSYQVG